MGKLPHQQSPEAVDDGDNVTKSFADANYSGGGAATALVTTGSPVVVSGAAPPLVGQILKATSTTTATWQADAGGGGGNTLDQAYDEGGGGAGRTITADSNAVVITNSADDNNNILEVVKTPATTPSSGVGILVTMGANTTGVGLSIVQSGTGAAAVVSGGAGLQVSPVVHYTSEAATVPGGSPAAGEGKLWVRSDTPNVLVFTDDAGADTVLGAGGGGNTLDGAYDQGGAGAGRAITANSGAVQITNSAVDTNNVLEITKSPSGADTGSALSITHNANASDPALSISLADVGSSTTRRGILLQDESTPSTSNNSPILALKGNSTDEGPTYPIFTWELQAVAIPDGGSSLLIRDSSSTVLTMDDVANSISSSYRIVPATTETGSIGTSSLRWDGLFTTSITMDQKAVALRGSELTSVFFDLNNQNIQFETSGAGPTLAAQRLFWIDPPQYTADAATLTITDASTVYIAGEPSASTNVTITNAYALWIDSGNSRFDGSLLPGATDSFSLGTSSLYWNGLYSNEVQMAQRALSTQTAEVVTAFFDLAANDIQFDQSVASPLAAQRPFWISPPNYTGDESLMTITDASTFYVEGPPTTGINATITNAYALWVDAGVSRFDGDIVPGATGTLDIGSSSLRWDRVYLDTGTASATGVQFDSASLYSNTAANMRIAISATDVVKISSLTTEFENGVICDPSAASSQPTALTVNQAAFTAATAETPAVEFALDTAALQFDQSTVPLLATQRAVKIDQPTYSADEAGFTITDAATLYVENAPAVGTNTTITNAYALWVDAGVSRFDGDVVPGATGSLDLGSSSLRWEAAYFDIGAFNASGVQFDSASLYAAAAGDLRVVVSANNIAKFGSTQLEVEQGLLCDPTGATSKPTALTVNQAAFTVVDTETPAVLFALGAGTMQFDTSAVPGSPTLASQRAVKIDQPTYSADAATLTISEASTVYIEGSPAAGTNTNITKSYALFVDSGTARFDGGASVVFELPADATDPTSGGTIGATGRIPVGIGAFIRYIPYY